MFDGRVTRVWIDVGTDNPYSSKRGAGTSLFEEGQHTLLPYHLVAIYPSREGDAEI
jgi:hypothetical protein